MRWPRFDHVAFIDVHARAVLNAVGRTLGAIGIGDRNTMLRTIATELAFAVPGDGLCS